MGFKVNTENGTLFLKEIKERSHMNMGEGVIAHVCPCMSRPEANIRCHPEEYSHLLWDRVSPGAHLLG